MNLEANTHTSECRPLIYQHEKPFENKVVRILVLCSEIP